MKTIFITAYHPFISRNIFNTDVLKTLRRRQDLIIVLFVPPNKKEFIEKYYGGSNIIVEGLDLSQLIQANKFWYRLAFILENTRYVKDQRLGHLLRHQNAIDYLNYWWLSFWAFVLSNLPPAKRFYRFLDYKFSPKDAFGEYFDKYNPVLVFSTDIFGETDVLLLRSAKASGISAVGMVRSWDNPTTKGILRIFPEKIIVNSPVIKEELVRIHDCKRENIFVAGLPQFDNWISEPTQSREEFFAKIGVNPNKRLILFAPAGNILSDTDWQLCQILKEALDEVLLPSNIQFLVRNHPNHPADLSKFKGDSRFVIELPGFSPKRGEKEWELSPDDNDHSKNSIYYSDVIMYVATSLGLDATVFDKPQIMVSFDGWESRPYVRSVRRYNREDCLGNLVKCGGTRVVKNRDEWIKSINDYLENPNLDQAGRAKVTREHLYKIDGKAGDRITNFILKFINDQGN